MLVRNLLKRNPQRKVENKKNFTFIGLWNPQKKYEKTRHNIGADCLVKLSEKNNISLKTHKSGKFQLGSYEEDGYEIDIVIPMVSMNNSGEAVKEYIKNKNMDYENLVVLHDDIDLGSGSYQFKDLYINGTANLDAVDIDSTVQIDGATTFGVDDTGVDVRMYSATTNEGVLYDASEDEVLDIADTYTFVSNDNFGNWFDPVILSTGVTQSIDLILMSVRGGKSFIILIKPGKQL